MYKSDDDIQLLTVSEVCDLLKIGITRAYELIGLGILPSIKIGALRRIPRRAVLDLAREGLPAAEATSPKSGGAA